MALRVAQQADVDLTIEHRREQLHDVLDSFDVLDLKQLEQAELVDRRDEKFVFHARLVPGLLGSLCAYYQVLEVGGRRIHEYQTVYFDTPDLAFYRAHHAGKVHRCKVRSRYYETSGTTFLEVKRKTGLERTRKERLQIQGLLREIGGEAAEFVASHLAPTRLSPVLESRFQRITLVAPGRPERVTLDLDVSFSTSAALAVLDNACIAEVKLPDRSTSHFKQAMRALHIQASNFSKYAVGVALLFPQVKHNRFKEQLLRLQKLTKGTSHA